uniref:GH3 auxin-responsive promoter family protein n=1 Tax=Fulvivirga sp. TaxID=1931237 RepID=UPI0040495556
MGIRSILSRPFAWWVVKQQRRWMANPREAQLSVFNTIIKKATDTKFGKDHQFASIKSYDDFKRLVPIRDYEALSPYVKLVTQGEENILWPGKPAYFAKTSGTTSGTKYIPITKDSIPNHINSARDALLNYVYESGNGDFLDGKLIFLSGSPVLDSTAGIPTGRLSGIVNHHVPAYLRTNQMPSYDTNCMDNWEDKVDKIVEETIEQPMSLISGIPPWVQMYFDKLEAIRGAKIKDIFPDFSLFVYGGVNFEPYRAKLFESIGKKIDTIETYPASEGFIAFQDSQLSNGLLLLLNSGIFFEFIPASEYFDENPTRLKIDEVQLDTNYAIIINSNAGLWGYSIGDTVKFVSLAPYRIIFTGRIKHFISAFGEHVIGEEVEKAMKQAMQKHQEVEITEFTVAPNVSPAVGMPHHEWFVEFSKSPEDFEAFSTTLNEAMVQLNSYYDDLISGNILTNLKISQLQPGTFVNYMKSLGKLGGQNKMPRLSNDRNIAAALEKYKIESFEGK